MNKDVILKDWTKYGVIVEGEYKFLIYDALNRIANALEKIAEDDKALVKNDN